MKRGVKRCAGLWQRPDCGPDARDARSGSGQLDPVTPTGVYRNVARVSAVGADCEVSMGWLCYDVNKVLLGQVMCANKMPVALDVETGTRVAQNLLANPSAEGPAFNTATGWGSDDLGGAVVLAAVSQSTEQATHRTNSAKAVWPNPAGGATQSNCVIASIPVPAHTPMTFGAWVYVPTGSPNVALTALGFASSLMITTKDAWTYVELPFTTGAASGQIKVGMMTATPSAGKMAYIDQALLRSGQTPLPHGRVYFDGSTNKISDGSFVWDGDPNDSSSSYYLLEPSWDVVEGYIAVGDETEPAVGSSSDVMHAANPIPNTIYFQPFFRCDTGTCIIDTHEVARENRSLNVRDGVTAGWVEAVESVTAPLVVANQVSPPDTEPPSFLDVGPLSSPPADPGNAISMGWLNMLLGQPVDSQDPVPPQFLWAGDPGDEPIPDDLDFTFTDWPPFSLWLDTSVVQARISLLAGTHSGSAYVTCPAVDDYIAAPSTYGVIFTPPVDGIILHASTGSCFANSDDYLQMRSGLYSGVNDNGGGGTVVTLATGSSHGASGATASRGGYCSVGGAAVQAGVQYRAGTEYSHGGPTASISRDRTLVLFIPGGVQP